MVWRRRDRAARKKLGEGRNHAGEDFRRASLADMDLSGYVFVECDFWGADLTAATLVGARFARANLQSAYLTGAQMINADLSGANLRGAYLLATNFSGADLDGIDISDAIWDQATTWPAGFDPWKHPSRLTPKR